MIGIVTSAVRDTETNIMLTTKLSAMAPSSAACQIFPARSSAITRKVGATAHNANSWL